LRGDVRMKKNKYDAILEILEEDSSEEVEIEEYIVEPTPHEFIVHKDNCFMKVWAEIRKFHTFNEECFADLISYLKDNGYDVATEEDIED